MAPERQPLEVKALSDWGLGLDRPFLIAGPCSAESREQVLATAKGVAAVPGVKAFRAGVWKPRTRPGAFEGAGEAALDWLCEVKETTGLLTLTEVATAEHVEACLKAGIDALWIGARTTPNPFSVQEIADAVKGTDVPVLVKNPINPTSGFGSVPWNACAGPVWNGWPPCIAGSAGSTARPTATTRCGSSPSG